MRVQHKTSQKVANLIFKLFLLVPNIYHSVSLHFLNIQWRYPYKFTALPQGASTYSLETMDIHHFTSSSHFCTAGTISILQIWELRLIYEVHISSRRWRWDLNLGLPDSKLTCSSCQLCYLSPLSLPLKDITSTDYQSWKESQG